MATEFFAEGGKEVAITLTPGESGVLQVHVDGDKIFDKTEEGSHPNLDRVKELKAIVKERLTLAVAAD
jgi:predicted Rdx family selenoprotein